MPRFKSLQKKQNSDQESSQPAPTIQTASRKSSGSHWTVEAIHSEKNVKKLKVKVKEVLNLTCEERIIVDFDYLDEPFGDARGLLSGFCGKWAANNLNLWSASEDPLKSRAEIIDNVADGIPLDQWISFVDYQYKDSTKEKNELVLSQSTMDESQISPNDAIDKVLGKEHSGSVRVRCLGFGHVSSRVFKQVRPRFGGTSVSSSEGSCSSQCQQNHNQMMNALKAYMIMKEGTIPEQFAGFFVSTSTISPTTPSDAGSGPLSPLDPRRSCGGSNSSDDR
ncbi:uncharacterized protein LOC142180811 [Nicotiana tabacum]|uniref:Uncharacterized protein LOC142180811 n=1 Tax=Nicotiana tabacum TaxID=4097 RepID=A0AC58UHM6_TOBAC